MVARHIYLDFFESISLFLVHDRFKNENFYASTTQYYSFSDHALPVCLSLFNVHNLIFMLLICLCVLFLYYFSVADLKTLNCLGHCFIELTKINE